jgi:glutamate/aspartate transport system substrate-binding protein
MKRMQSLRMLALSILVLRVTAWGAPVPAREFDATLSKIRDTGVITLGHRASSIPFSYYDDQRQVIGYSHELMLRVVAALRAELGLPGLQIKLIPVTSTSRIPLVQRGAVDLECGSTTHNQMREEVVGFSNSLFVVGTRLLVRKDSGILDFPDLAGKTVVTTAGTTSQGLLDTINRDMNLNVRILSVQDHGEAFLALQSGQAAAFHTRRCTALWRDRPGGAAQRLGGRRYTPVI